MFNTFPPSSFSPSLHSCYNFLFDVRVCVWGVVSSRCVCSAAAEIEIICWQIGAPAGTEVNPGGPVPPWGRQTDRQIESVDECFGRISKFALSSYIHTQIAIHNQRHFKLNFSHTQFVPFPCPALPFPASRQSALSFICGKFSTCYRLGSSAKKERGGGGMREKVKLEKLWESRLNTCDVN